MCMKHMQSSRLLNTAILAISLSLWAGCTKTSTPEENQATIQNIKMHTIAKRFGDRCIAILAAEEESLRAIDQATRISPSDSKELKEMTRRYTIAAIQSKIPSSQQGISDYWCTIFWEKSLLNPPTVELIKQSKSLTPEDRQKLFLQWGVLKK